MWEVAEVDSLRETLREKQVAIVGLGGLGSNIAVMLTRSGVGRLLLIDFDTVEASNLNRQHYLPRHIGMPKAEALAGQLKEIDPTVQLTVKQQRVTADNAAELLQGWPLVCEAMDDPASKAMLINALLPDPEKVIVAGSGMAGFGSANTIKTVRRMARLYVCGDGTSDMKKEKMLATRVQICAGHQANMILRLLLGQQEP